MAPPLQYRPKSFFGPGSVYVSSPAAQGESGVRRLAIHKDELVTQPGPGVDTVPDIIAYAARTHGDRPAMGWRDIVRVHTEEKDVKKTVDGKETTEKKKWNYFEMSEYKFISYFELQEAISEVARALVKLGIEVGEVIDIFAETSVNWQIMSQGCALTSVTIATAYDTLGEEGLTHSLNEPKCAGIYTTADLLPGLVKVLPNAPTVRFVFYDGKPPQDLLDKTKGIREDIQLFHVDQLRDIGKQEPLSTLDSRKPNRETLACIMYTSGSTGKPKGVCLSNGNIVSAIGGMYLVFEPHIQPGNRIIAYLPLAHVLEFAVELCAMYAGVTCGYARSKTLTDASVRNCKGDIAAFKPNIMFGVPAVWEAMRKGVMTKVEKGGWLATKVFGAALQAKKLGGGLIPFLNWAVDYVVLNKVKEALGGELRFAVNGGAGISFDTQEFFNLAIGPLLQGYGLTESCGMVSFLPPDLVRPETFSCVGLPAPAIEIKFLDCPDMGYFSSTEVPEGAKTSGNASSQAQHHLPQGEICIRGNSVTKGYFNRPDLNSDENIFTKDGWFRTGDIGQWNEDGTLSIIDRLKNLVKMQNGEYIAIERLEAIYKSCNLIANMCVHAPTNAVQPMAIAFPHEQNLRSALSKGGDQKAPKPTSVDPGVDPKKAKSADTPSMSDLSSRSLAELCSEPSVRALVLKECNALAKKNGFARMEMLSAVLLTPEEWTPQNGLVTAAQKVNRSKIVDQHKDEIKEIFDRLS